MHKTYSNPYATITGESHKVFVRIPEDTYNALKAPRLASGTLTTTMAILLDKLQNELKQRGITDFSHSDRYEHFIANLELRLPAESHSIVETDGGD